LQHSTILLPSKTTLNKTENHGVIFNGRLILPSITRVRP
jgi:hypothetical protein